MVQNVSTRVMLYACMYVCIFWPFITMTLPMWWIFRWCYCCCFHFEGKTNFSTPLANTFQCIEILDEIAITRNQMAWLQYSSHTFIHSCSRPAWVMKIKTLYVDLNNKSCVIHTNMISVFCFPFPSLFLNDVTKISKDSVMSRENLLLNFISKIDKIQKTKQNRCWNRSKKIPRNWYATYSVSGSLLCTYLLPNDLHNVFVHY